MIRLSLIIATYNRAEQLMVTLSSVAEQSADSALWECIVVDNNSKDDTRQRVTAFKESYSHLNMSLYRVSLQHAMLAWRGRMATSWHS